MSRISPTAENWIRRELLDRTLVWQIPSSLADFMRYQGHQTDWAAAQRRAVAAARRLGDDAVQARAPRSLGRALTRLGHFDDAGKHLQQALAIYQRHCDSIWQALFLCWQARAREGQHEGRRDLQQPQ